MNIVFNCPHCNVQMTVDEAGVGETVPCPTCNNEFQIPQGRPEEEVKTEKAADEAAAAPAAPAAPAQKPLNPTPPQPGVKPAGDAAPAEKTKEPEKKKDAKPKIPSGKDLAALLPNQKKAGHDDHEKGPGMRVKSIQHHLCIDMGKDLFDATVAKFIKTVPKEDIVSITPLSYSYKDSGGDIISDYGVMIVYHAKE
ncbi:MAG: hypothetical protein CMO80_20830 [Verrucomicrobiales bacterium]|nr:hypothetical protein [Verrucomicrobiales bacterium]|tara:strand:+ start:720 stop:1307 length:588 start_codon:yes stop_codon:yes gene_type:complete